MSRPSIILVECFSAPPIRQPEERGEEDPARPSARGDNAVHCLPLALAFRERLLHAGGTAREGSGFILHLLAHVRCKLWVTTPIAQPLSVMGFGERSTERLEKNLTFVVDALGVKDSFPCVAFER